MADSRETGIQCEPCGGEGIIVKLDGSTHAAHMCPCCKGAGWISVERWRAWRLAHFGAVRKTDE